MDYIIYWKCLTPYINFIPFMVFIVQYESICFSWISIMDMGTYYIFKWQLSNYFKLYCKLTPEQYLAVVPHHPSFFASVCFSSHIFSNETKSSMLNGTRQLYRWCWKSLLLVPEGTNAAQIRWTDGIRSIRIAPHTNNVDPMKLALDFGDVSVMHASKDRGTCVWA